MVKCSANMFLCDPSITKSENVLVEVKILHKSMGHKSVNRRNTPIQGPEPSV